MDGTDALDRARRAHYRDRDVARAWVEYERALACFDATGDGVSAAEVVGELANLRLEQGWWSEAIALVHEAKQRAARAGATALGVRLDTMTGEIALRSGDRDAAERASARAVETARRTGHELGAALMTAARVAQDDRRLDHAARLLDEAVAALERSGDARRATLARLRRGLVALEQGVDALPIIAAALTDAPGIDPLIAREAALYTAAAHALARRDAEARIARAAAEAIPDGWTSSRHGRHVTAIYAAVVAAARGDPEARRRAAEAALAAEAPGADGSAAVNCFYVVRAGVRLVRRLVPEAAPIQRTRVADDGRWFQLVDGRIVELGHRPILARTLAALASAGHATVTELLAAGWPGQAAVGGSGEMRVYSTILRLRKLGLRDHIVAVDGGYRLVAEVVRSVPA